MLKAVILAGGKGTRMYPLTVNCPKPLLKIIDKTIIEHNLEQLQGIIGEAIIVIGYKAEMIKSFLGGRYKKIKISYIIQEPQEGTADAAIKASGLIDDRFILLNGDDLYFKKDIINSLKKFPSIMLGLHDNPLNFGIVECCDDFVESLTEKTENFSDEPLINTGLYFLNKSIFRNKIEKSPRGEYEFTDFIKCLIKKEKLYFYKSEKWMPLSYPWDILKANEVLMKNIKRKIKGRINNAFILKNVIIEKGAVIKSGTRIEGPAYVGSGSVVGPNAYLRPNSVVGNNCLIGPGVEIKNSVIKDNTNIPHLSYVGDSIIGSNCNIGGGTMIANLGFKKENIKVIFNNSKIDTKRRKLGIVMGDNCSTGINCSLMPGITIGDNSIIGPHSLVKNNIERRTKYFCRFEEIVKKNEQNNISN
jgi:UDP-N-acetylglucosamine diphosphorylase / glucose-1-phosphate thymidylyltransferase / UDP-N-acetylgalactosamine diphosphorylase / glucosamine-1-phosphate N-acetyltransferase / galactosamine-1-phosphate N-acetyltransferase